MKNPFVASGSQSGLERFKYNPESTPNMDGWRACTPSHEMDYSVPQPHTHGHQTSGKSASKSPFVDNSKNTNSHMYPNNFGSSSQTAQHYSAGANVPMGEMVSFPIDMWVESLVSQGLIDIDDPFFMDGESRTQKSLREKFNFVISDEYVHLGGITSVPIDSEGCVRINAERFLMLTTSFIEQRIRRILDTNAKRQMKLFLESE
jgi:hypothetical protein